MFYKPLSWISLNWSAVHAVVHDDQNSVNMKEIVSQNMISESEPLNRLFEEKNTRETVGDVSVHTGVRLQIVDAAENILFFWACLQQVQVVILMSFTHFLELRDAERLYVSTRDLPDATRGKLVVVEASSHKSNCVSSGVSIFKWL